MSFASDRPSARSRGPIRRHALVAIAIASAVCGALATGGCAALLDYGDDPPLRGEDASTALPGKDGSIATAYDASDAVDAGTVIKPDAPVLETDASAECNRTIDGEWASRDVVRTALRPDRCSTRRSA